MRGFRRVATAAHSAAVRGAAPSPIHSSLYRDVIAWSIRYYYDGGNGEKPD